MDPWEMETRTKAGGPHPAGLSLTHAYLKTEATFLRQTYAKLIDWSECV